jgi:hypothetical protein
MRSRHAVAVHRLEQQRMQARRNSAKRINGDISRVLEAGYYFVQSNGKHIYLAVAERISVSTSLYKHINDPKISGIGL